MQVRPTAGRVIAVPESQERMSEGGIELPENRRDDRTFIIAKCIAVGLGRVLDSGDRLDVEVEVGQKIVYSQYAGVPIPGSPAVMLAQEDVVGVVVE